VEYFAKKIGITVESLLKIEAGERDVSEDLETNEAQNPPETNVPDQKINNLIQGQHGNTTFNIEPFAAMVGYAAEVAVSCTHGERVRAARMLRSALAVLEDSGTEQFAEPKMG
jgi:anthranilate phosphoribosyltransferase